MKTAWLFPGQGSQYVGMGRELFARFAPARALLEQASELMGMDLGRLIARGPESLLTRTDYLQPAITVVDMGCALLLENEGLHPDAVAGHSLGEYSALFAAGVLDAGDCLRLVVERGRLMHEASASFDAGMLAVIDGALQQVEEGVRALSADHVIGIGNYNGPRQVVVTGANAALAALALAQTALGARCVPLKVSGPWHSRLLAPAAARFGAVLRDVRMRAPRVPVALNVTGALCADPATIGACMQEQLCAPVKWMQAQRALHAYGIGRFLEVGPGNVLRGLARGIPETADCDVISVEGPRSLRFVTPAVARASHA